MGGGTGAWAQARVVSRRRESESRIDRHCMAGWGWKRIRSRFRALVGRPLVRADSPNPLGRLASRPTADERAIVCLTRKLVPARGGRVEAEGAVRDQAFDLGPLEAARLLQHYRLADHPQGFVHFEK